MKPDFMLDTDTVSFALRGQGNVAARILDRRPSEICISAITFAELQYGAARRRSRKLTELIHAFTANIAVLPFDEACAMQFGPLGNDLAERGLPIGEYDVLIAAHALALGLTLVTNNVRHFDRVSGLRVENWA